MDDYNRKIMLRNSKPNPLFEEWLEQLLGEAVEKKSRLEPMLRQALDSIRKYPLRLESGADCAILIGFHKKLCDFLDHRFAVYASIVAEELDEGCLEPQNIADIDERGNKIYEKTVSSTNNELDSAVNGHNNQDDSPERAWNTSAENREASCIPSRGELQDMPARAATISEQIRRTLALNIVSQNDAGSTGASDSQNGEPKPGQSFISACTLSEPGPSTSNKKSPKSLSPKGKGKFIPGYGQPSYAILLALLEYSKTTPLKTLTRKELAKLGQKYCNTPLFMTESNKCSTELISTATKLVKKGLIQNVRSKRIEYRITDEGKSLAQQLLKEPKNIRDVIVNDIYVANNEAESDNLMDVEMGSESSIEGEPIEFPAGSYDIILLIDKNETSGVSNRDDPTVALFNKYPGLKHEYRSLKVGDFTWIAQHRTTKQELVLPYIIERKRMDDLAASIKDGRFHEQKFRLHKCGLSNVYYMVESHGKNKNLGLPIQSLRQALANTRIHDGYKILASNSLANTVRLLVVMSNKMISDYKDKTLRGRDEAPRADELQTYQYFSKVATKNKALNVNGLFLKQLLQLKGLSVEKALAISKMYPTPHILVEEYQRLSQSQGEMLLANLKYGDASRNVGPIVSKIVYELFTKRVEE